MTEPLISVIMPAYNADRYIAEAVDSVRMQTYKNWELLVLDDGSADQSCQIVQALAKEDSRIRLIKNEKNMGVARTRNRGFDLCKGSYVALLDADDLWHPTKLEKQLALLEQTGAQLAYSSYAIVNSQGQKVKGDYLVPETVTFRELLKENVIGCSAVLLRSELLQKHRFQTDFFHEDYVLWLQLLQEGYRAVGCRDVLLSWRFVENSRSFNKKKAAKNRWRIYRDYLHLPLHRSLWAFGHYALRSLRKYRSKAK